MIESPPLFLGVSPKVENEGRGEAIQMHAAELSERECSPNLPHLK
jgi:hypothetical protein